MSGLVNFYLYELLSLPPDITQAVVSHTGKVGDNISVSHYTINLPPVLSCHRY